MPTVNRNSKSSNVNCGLGSRTFTSPDPSFTFEFEELDQPPRDLLIQATAFDASGKKIGSGMRSTSFSPDGCNHFPIYIVKSGGSGEIKYPDDGTRPNVLAPEATAFTSELPYPSLGFVADLPPGAELTVRITRTSGEGTGDCWWYGAVNGLHWQITMWDGEGPGPQDFTAVHDGRLDLESFNFTGKGAATFEFFENGNETPGWSKEVSWKPAAGIGPDASPSSHPG